MTTIQDLYNFADDEGITVLDFALHNREALSTVGTDGKYYIAIDPKKVSCNADAKTKIAHELGHCATGALYHAGSTCRNVKRCENEADKWAIKKLISQDELNRAVGKGYTEVWELAELFGVTEPFMLKVISLYKFGNLYEAVDRRKCQ